jgi:hypothetical protein
MKKYLNLSLCLFLALGFVSCDTDDEGIETKDVGGYAYLSNRSITVFDTNEDLSIKLFTAAGVTAETVEIVQGGSVIGTATVSGETASFNTSILGAFEFEDEDGDIHPTGSFPIKLRTTYSNGNVSTDAFTIAVKHAITLDKDNPSSTNMDDLMDVELAYEVSTFAATVDDVMLEVKEGSEGTYKDTSLDLSTEGEAVALSSIDFAALGMDLQVNDTLYYRFTATSGTLTDSASSKLVISPKAFTASGSGVLSSDDEMSTLDFDLEFLDPTGFQVVSGSDLELVMVADDYFDNVSEGVISAREAFMAGTPVTSYTNVENGDVFVYSATRQVEDEDGNTEDVTVYGTIKVSSVTTTTVDGNTTVYYTVSYAEGS